MVKLASNVGNSETKLRFLNLSDSKLHCHHYNKESPTAINLIK